MFPKTDVDPPKFAMCQGTVYGFTYKNSLKGRVNWREPYAKDNVDNTINIIKTGSAAPNKLISAGVHQVIYKAFDSAGNRATPCEIKVVMKGKRKQKHIVTRICF